MHLMSCEHPVRVFNKYLNEFVWTTCGKCNSCKNRRAKFWTDALERERADSKFTMFVTLTYDDYSLPVYNFTGGFEVVEDVPENLRGFLLSTRLRDVECLALSKDLFDTDADRELFSYYLKNNGIPYASKSDIQLFNKRLNKYFHDHVTNKYKNFRYFIVSEYGSTTLRPHFHALYFTDDNEVARCFQDGVLSCWKFGRIDCQYVENSACSYVAQYINKLSDLPSFYKAKPIRPFFLASRNPIIGSCDKYGESDKEIFDKCSVESLTYSRKDSRYVLTPIDKSTENRLYPKCAFYRSLSDSLRTELYTISSRFNAQGGYREFREKVQRYLRCIYNCPITCEFSLKPCSFSEVLRKMVDSFSKQGDNWLRRCYYLSRKFLFNAKRFGISIYAYLRKIDEYWNKKELYLLKKFYGFQEEYVKQANSDISDIALMYPDYLWNNGFTIGDYLKLYEPDDVKVQRKDAAYFAFSNKITHFKNMYLESLKVKNNHYYKQLKRFYHAKKCNEISEALSA